VGTSTARELSAAFAQAVNRGDLPAARDLWRQDAVLVSATGEAIQGRAAVAAALQAQIDSTVRVAVALDTLHEAGDVAIASGTLTLTAPDGFTQRSSSVVVYRRGDDGWRIAVDAPWGLKGL
jgi:uncharacterized protein (TIGR02246 family)